MRHSFEAEQWLPYTTEQMFAFFADPENLPRLMPKWQKAKIEAASYVAPPPEPQDGRSQIRWESGRAAGAGTRMTITFRPVPLSPVRVSWYAEITEFVWNDHFCDTQLQGPFGSWHHCHRLLTETRGGIAGTLLRDEVKYEMPFGVLGELAQRVIMQTQFRAIFNYRHEQTARLVPLMRSTM